MKGLDNMSKSALLLNIPDSFKYKVAKCIANAVGDDIEEDIIRNRLDEKNNSDANRQWDFLNRNLKEEFLEDYDVVVCKTKRGPWIMSPVFERKTGTLMTLMREERFKGLKSSCLKDENNYHYVAALTSCLNEGLLPETGELTLFELYESEDEKNIKQKIVANILNDLQVSFQKVGMYAVILFESQNRELVSLRCCVLDSMLNIIAEDDWSAYITLRESVVVEQVDAEQKLSNRPNRGLSLKAKAMDKKGQKRKYSKKTKDSEEEKNI